MSDYRMSFIRDVETALSIHHTPEEIAQIINIVVKALSEYEITARCTDLVPQDDINERLLRRYRACLMVDGKSDGTIEVYTRTAERLSEMIRKPFPEMGTYDIRFFLATCQEKGTSNRTLESYRSFISTFFQWMVDDEVITKNPTSAIKPIRYKDEIRKPFSDVELDSLRIACKDQKIRAIVEFLASTGVRVTEMATMQIDDVNFTTLAVHVRNGKGNKERITYMTPVAARHLMKYLSTRTDEDPALFLSQRGPYKKGGIENALKVLGAKAGVEGVHPHRFRRTFATNLAKRGMDIQEVQKLMGHNSISTTMIYVSTEDSRVESSYKRFTA